MTERPILFSAPMVRALLSGVKTQTRRAFNDKAKWRFIEGHGDLSVCPYGQPGDRLWVREAFSGPWCMEAQDGLAAAPPSKWGESSEIWYWADGEPTYGDWTKPRPSIHMPRWASRITLEVTDVRVERLQDISEADALAEGVNVHPDHHGKPRTSIYSPVQAYADLWDRINGPESWAANPWVWAVSFRRITP